MEGQDERREGRKVRGGREGTVKRSLGPQGS